jgi:hypothetical protein
MLCLRQAPLAPYGWLSLGSPVLMFVLLRFVSGVVINDRVQAEKKPHYREYIANTSAFFPLPCGGSGAVVMGAGGGDEGDVGLKEEYERLA